MNEAGIFPYFACKEGKITRSRLVLRLPSNSLCYREERSCFSVTMASRFEIVDKECIEELKRNSENENTMISKEYWKNVFKKWANESKFRRVRERCPRPNTVAVLCIQKFSNFAHCVINK